MTRRSKTSKAIDGLAESLACRHDWQPVQSKVPGQTVRQCSKCKTRMTSWETSPVPQGKGFRWPAKTTKRAHQRERSPSVRLAGKRSPSSTT